MATRNTVQKSIVLQALNELANHPTADAVYDHVHASHPSISKATVYRVLNKMSDEDQVLRVRINNGADHFDHQVFPHYHVRCIECGRVDDVIIPLLSEVEEQAAEASLYLITGCSLQFDGICPACQAAGFGKGTAGQEAEGEGAGAAAAGEGSTNAGDSEAAAAGEGAEAATAGEDSPAAVAAPSTAAAPEAAASTGKEGRS